MGYRLFDFCNVPWTPGAHPLERKRAIEGAPAVEISFEPGFHDPNACRSGHAGYVLEGTLAIDFDAGDSLTVQAGNGFLIDAGTSHRARNPGAGAVRLFIYSWRD
ncbi:MAG: cupin domain-containing protein [Acidobacteriota bacterium]